MVAALERHIDELSERFPPITDFVVPGHDRVAALLDVARTAVRRAERQVLMVDADQEVDEGATEGDQGDVAPSYAVPYLNRLSDLVWTMARWQEHGESLLSRRAPRSAPTTREEAPDAS
jgi:cob(I)alamin adenosyltransferase